MGVSGAWARIVDNIAMVRSHGFHVEVHMVPMLPNYKHTLSMLELCEDLGVDKLSLLRFVPQTRGQANNRNLALNVEEFTWLQHNLDALNRHVALRHTDVYPTQVRAGCPYDFRHAVFSDVHKKMHPCHAGTDLILVRPRGDVHPCAAWKSLPETDNVRDKPLVDIWKHGEVFEALRRYRETDWADIMGVCSNCKYQPSCKSGCPAQRMHALKLKGLRPDSAISDLYIDAADPLCPAAHTLAVV
jgi:radical SAM protein with 4Fe4S-binding SPASM domain